MAKNYLVNIRLSDEEMEFIELLAAKDGMCIVAELRMLLRLQIREEMELKEAELKGEQ